MKKVSDSLENKTWRHRLDPNELSQTILADSMIATFIRHHQLSAEQIELSLPKFHQFMMEKRRFATAAPDYIAKGYEPVLVMNEGYADVSYKETEHLKQAKADREVTERITVMGLPKSYKAVTFADIALDDIKRIEAFKHLEAFVATYSTHVGKGLYLYGDMGIGKSYLMAALARELAEKKQAKVTFLHYPTFVLDIKKCYHKWQC